MPEMVFIGLGSNMGDRLANLRAAGARLSSSPGITLIAASSVYETPPMGVLEQQADYLNQVLKIECAILPGELLNLCQSVERALGRPADHKPLAPRLIDVDIITYGDQVLEDNKLALPHPEYTSRQFVLAPLQEIDPGFRDPVTGQSIRDLLADCPEHPIEKVWTEEPVPC
ncbi:MAG: 2-amino-4-hydroxy-6-hydroxymethyldihydropteridine diphosphokinase [Candidatus Marinimicrobia bacterium]|nr:2-amino-4-hydroxy-6-hydroxymethyldihydropteridine diphosphokinase [Candidatus Neomarinimicrobiota bacterium]